MKKIGVHLKTKDGKSKPGWEIRLELQIGKQRQQAKIQKQNIKIYSDEEEKARQLKRKVQLDETNHKVLATKKIPRQDQTIQTKQDIPKQLKKILPTSIEVMGEDISPIRCERGKMIFEQNMETERS